MALSGILPFLSVGATVASCPVDVQSITPGQNEILTVTLGSGLSDEVQHWKVDIGGEEVTVESVSEQGSSGKYRIEVGYEMSTSNPTEKSTVEITYYGEECDFDYPLDGDSLTLTSMCIEGELSDTQTKWRIVNDSGVDVDYQYEIYSEGVSETGTVRAEYTMEERLDNPYYLYVDAEHPATLKIYWGDDFEFSETKASGGSICEPEKDEIPSYEGDDYCPTGTVKNFIESHQVDSTDEEGIKVNFSAGDYLFKAGGTYSFRYQEPDWRADAGHSTKDGWDNLLSDYGIYGEDPNLGAHALLGDLGDGVGIIDWGQFNEDHEYKFHYRFDEDYEAQFVIGDRYGEWFGTEWDNQEGMDDNEGFLNLDVYSCEPAVTIVATKLICDQEDLPEWGDGGADITADTINDFEGCEIDEDWKFQWAQYGTDNPGDNEGEIDDQNWNTFTGSTSIDVSDLNEDSRIWVREVFQEGYLPFTGVGGESPSAEFYCHTDVLNYDNYERIDNIDLKNGGVYHCVAFNVPLETEEETGSITVNKHEHYPAMRESEEIELTSSPILPGWEITVTGNGYEETKETTSDGVKFENLKLDESYRVCETMQPGWAFAESWTSQDNQHESLDLENSEGQDYCVDIYLDENNQDAHINFFNRRVGQIEIIKEVEGYDGDWSFDFSVDYQEKEETIGFYENSENGFTLDSSNPYESGEDLSPGIYTITETVPDGWNLDDISCSVESLGNEFTPAVSLDSYTTNVEDGSVEINLSGGEKVTCTFENSYEEEEQDSGTGTTGRRSSQRVVPTTTTDDEETDEPVEVEPIDIDIDEEQETCGIYLNEFIRFGADNNPDEVTRLQLFLNFHMGEDLEVNGVYDMETMEAVNRFQLEYREEILRPWVEEGIHDSEDNPTGYVFETTRRWINLIMCEELGLPMPDLSQYAVAEVQPEEVEEPADDEDTDEVETVDDEEIDEEEEDEEIVEIPEPEEDEEEEALGFLAGTVGSISEAMNLGRGLLALLIIAGFAALGYRVVEMKKRRA